MGKTRDNHAERKSGGHLRTEFAFVKSVYRRAEGRARRSLDAVYGDLAEFPRAIVFLDTALTIAREVSDRPGEADAYCSLGNVTPCLENTGARSTTLQERFLAIALELGVRANQGVACGNLGGEYINLGEYQRAIELFGKSLAIALEMGHRGGEGRAPWRSVRLPRKAPARNRKPRAAPSDRARGWRPSWRG
jgi:tetratricopeptide (TPR) repeat protein